MQVAVPPWSHSEFQGYREGRKHLPDRTSRESIHPLSLGNGPSDSNPLFCQAGFIFFFFFSSHFLTTFSVPATVLRSFIHISSCPYDNPMRYIVFLSPYRSENRFRAIKSFAQDQALDSCCIQGWLQSLASTACLALVEGGTNLGAKSLFRYRLPHYHTLSTPFSDSPPFCYPDSNPSYLRKISFKQATLEKRHEERAT